MDLQYSGRTRCQPRRVDEYEMNFGWRCLCGPAVAASAVVDFRVDETKSIMATKMILDR